MNSRTWVAVVLCCLVWFVYMRWYAPVPPTELHNQSVQTTGQTPDAKSTTTATPGTATPDATGAQPSTAPAASTTGSGHVLPMGFVPAETIKRETPQLAVSLSNLGGKPSRILTRTHVEVLEPGAPSMPVFTPEENPWELATVFTDKDLASLGTSPYSVKENGASIAMSNQVDGALSIYKEYTISDGHYLGWKLVVNNLNAARKDWGYMYVPVGKLHAEYVSDDPLKAWEAVSYQDESVKRHTIDSLPTEEWLKGSTGWLAFGNRYFTTAVIPSGSLNPDVGFIKDASWNGGVLRFPLIFKEGSNELAFDLKVFAGPKDYDLLKATPGLGSLIDYGMFSFLAFPLLELLRFFHKFVANWGLAIILLTILVRALFYPLSLKGYRSMKAMQKLQPQIAALKEKYKDDTQRFGQEQMALFRTHKVNPAGGCLPMLVQLPVFIALYAVLSNSVELLHAPFYFWINDLSAKDPFYVFPVLMGISMFVQQKMTPTVGMDPMQQKILLLMPIVFSFIMLNLPSGLTIYIFLSTLLGILQQVLMNRDKDSTAKVALPT